MVKSTCPGVSMMLMRIFGELLIHPPPERRGRGRGDGDAALLLLHHPVHDGRAVVDLAHLVGNAGVEEDALGRRGLAGVDVRHDADVAIDARWGSADDKSCDSSDASHYHRVVGERLVGFGHAVSVFAAASPPSRGSRPHPAVRERGAAPWFFPLRRLRGRIDGPAHGQRFPPGDARTSTGTWYVAPPTRLDFTSTTGLMLSSAWARSSSDF